MKKTGLLFLCLLWISAGDAQKKNNNKTAAPTTLPSSDLNTYFKPLKWRNIGPFRGGRSVAVTGVVKNPLVYYMGTTGGGVWKTTDGGTTWQNISDGYFKTGSVGAVAVAPSDPNMVYVGMGEHAPRGVMTSYGDGVYKSTDGGQTWKKMGLDLTRHIAGISIDPQNPDIVYVAAQGALYAPSEERGVYKSTDGGSTWTKILYIDEHTGCADLSMDITNPRILYAAMWDHQRTPWQIRSGGKGSGLYKSTDGGATWLRLEKGLPKELGKMGISVSRANPNKVYALIESDTRSEKGGVFVSNDGGKSWTRISKDHSTVQRAWYYIEIFADPQDENTVYVLNTSILKSIDGGKTWNRVTGSHGDNHQLWINPDNHKNMIVANDGGAAITFNAGQTWSTENNQPTAQFYRVNADNRFPYYVYGGQQDNTSVMIASRNPGGAGITDKDWKPSAGGESAFLAFNPDDPRYVMGGSYQGTIELLDQQSDEGKPVMVAPIQYQSLPPKEMKYRFNWNAPIIASRYEPHTFYHAGNRLFKTSNLGKSWEVISPDLTRNDTTKQGPSGVPFTNEGAGGENYGTLSYIIESPHEKGVIWTGSDDGLVHLTRDGGKTWTNITPADMGETLVNSIEVSPHDKATAYIATTRYKFNDLAPGIYKTTDYGASWTKIVNGLPYGAYTRVVREDPARKGLLYAGTETGFYISYDAGNQWIPLQLNLPVAPITDLKVHQGNLIASTMGRAFWILDNLSVLREYEPSMSTNNFHLYQPENTYRVSGGSSLDKVSQEDEEEENLLRPGRFGFAGTNPASGVVLYYQLPAKTDSTVRLTLEIMNEQGQLVRKYSSVKDSQFISFPGGPPADPTLPLKPGLNRFVWDLRYPTLPGVEHVFIEGSYEGHKAAPGSYQARLTAGTQQGTVSFRVLPDPRINATAADYEAQHQTLTAIEEDIRDIHYSVNSMRKVRKQLHELADLLDGRPDLKPVIDSAKALAERISSWEEKLVQPKAQSNDDIINFVNKLSADYIFLKGELDVNIPYVTDGQKQRLAELKAQWQPLRNERNQLQQDVASFNSLCSRMQVGAINLPVDH